jgi:RND family efflux transporter MFP subunit
MLDFTRVSDGKWKYVVPSILVLALLWLISACDSKRNEYVEPPPPKVTVAQPLQQEVIDYLEFTGNTRAFEEVEIRARVAGFLESMHFTPGTLVGKGDLLFVIDPREYQAEYNAAVAEVNAAKAQHHRSKIEYERAKRVFDQGAGRETDVVKWRGERDVALAAIERAKAKVERAKLDLSYTQVTAPITGRVSRNVVDIGNLVGGKEPTLLTTVIRYDPMYAYFNLNERDLLKVMAMYRQEAKKKGLDPHKDSAARAALTVSLGLANEENYPHQGIVDFAESGVDPATGTLQLRGVFPNPGPSPVLIPGFFASLRMAIGKRDNALLVTERAIGSDQSGRFLLVVNSENMVEKKPIRMGRLVDGLRVIEEGLQPDGRVVVNGLQRARPGAKVDPQPTDMKSLTASALKAAAEASGKEAAATVSTDNTKTSTAEQEKSPQGE